MIATDRVKIFPIVLARVLDSMSSCLKESSEDGSPKEIRQTKVAKSSTKTPKTTSGKRKRSTRRKITANSVNDENK